MRRPRSEEAFREYSYVKKFRDSEIELKDISGNLPKVAFIFPDSYNIASSSLAWSWIQQLLSHHGIGVHRFFYEPWFEKFYSLEDQRPIDEYPVWLFTFQFENNLLNIADMLIKKNIPLKASKRSDYHPLIIIGGPVTLFNHKIVEEIADFIFIGDLECSADKFAQVLNEYIKTGKCEQFKLINELYSKKFHKLSYTKCQGALSPVPHSHYVTSHSAFPNKLLIEIGRGCIWRCAFCVTGYTKKPVKFANLDDVLEIFEKYPDKEFGLISATITDYPYLSQLLEYIEKKDIKFSVSSMRVDKINKQLISLLKRSDRQSFTIAPEGISQKMRDVMMKDITTEEIFNGLILGREVGFEHVKLYYIVGFEEEGEDDYTEFFNFLVEVQKLGYKQITLSVNPLVPKPLTPFEGRKIIDKKTYDEITKKIRKNLPKSVKADFESYKESKLQYDIAYLQGNDTIEFLKEYFRI